MALKFLKIALLSLVVASVLPAASRADTNYTFIKVSCDAISKTATIKAFYDWNEEGKARAKQHAKDTYYLNDIAGYGEIDESKSLQGEIKVCDIDGQTVSFIAEQEIDHPRANGIRLFLNKKQVNAWFSLANGGWTVDLKFLGSGKFDLHECNDEHLPTEPQCTDTFVIDGKITRTKPNP